MALIVIIGSFCATQECVPHTHTRNNANAAAPHLTATDKCASSAFHHPQQRTNITFARTANNPLLIHTFSLSLCVCMCRIRRINSQTAPEEPRNTRSERGEEGPTSHIVHCSHTTQTARMYRVVSSGRNCRRTFDRTARATTPRATRSRHQPPAMDERRALAPASSPPHPNHHSTNLCHN